METTYITLTAREIVAEGGAVRKVSGEAAPRQLVCVRKAQQKKPAGGKVIDLAAWKADREEEARLEEQWYEGVDEAMESPVTPEPRARREHKTHSALRWLDAWASLAVVGVMGILFIRILAGV